jgi:hypothetical protein
MKMAVGDDNVSEQCRVFTIVSNDITCRNLRSVGIWHGDCYTANSAVMKVILGILCSVLGPAVHLLQGPFIE